MAIKIDIKYKGLIPKIKNADWVKLKTQEFLNIARWWHFAFRPIHFQPKGAKRYGYRNRKSKNIFRGTVTAKRYRGKISGAPLVWTGETLRKSVHKTLKASGVRSSVSMPIGHVNRYRPPGWPSGQMGYEIRKVLASEERQFAKEIERGLRDGFSRKKRNIKVTTMRKAT